MLSPATPGWLIPAEAKTQGNRWLLPAGPLWDAVRTPVTLGLPVVERLREHPADWAQLGPVLWDDRRDWLYWLVSPGHSDTYPEQARLLGAGSLIGAPLYAGQRLADAGWLHLPEQRIVSGPAWLAAALGEQASILGSAA